MRSSTSIPDEVVDHAWLTPRAALRAMADGSIAMWPPTSTTLQRLERADSFEEIRDGLARAEEPPIGIERISPDLRVMTGQSAFGPAGRPANTVLVGQREVVVVDPGDPGEAFVDAIEAEVAAGGGRIVAIALTHVDPGHASGIGGAPCANGCPDPRRPWRRSAAVVAGRRDRRRRDGRYGRRPA